MDDHKHMKLLLVEDDPDDVLLVQDQLAEVEAAACAVIPADSLKQAMERLAAESFDAVLLDLGLPDSEGLDGLARIRTETPQVPVVILTGLADQETALAAVRAGAQDYLVKGEFSPTALRRTLLYAIERQQAGFLRHLDS